MDLRIQFTFRNIIISVLVLVATINNGNLFAQTDISDNGTSNKTRKWIISASGGATLMWNDLTQEYDNPLSKYFSDQQGWAGGVMLSRRLGNSFTANLQYTGGFFQGHKDTWSNGDTADVSFHSSFNDINLNFEVDILNLFKNKKNRKFAPYLKAGIGYGFSNSTRNVYSTGAEVSSAQTSYLNIPWGWGIRFDLYENISLRFEHTFHMVMNDLAEGYAPPTSTVNDIFSYTSLGLSYRIPNREKKAKIEDKVEIEPIDSAIAKVDEPAFELTTAAKFPTDMKPNDTAEVIIRINKGELAGSAKFQQTLPSGFSIIPQDNGGAKYSFNNQILTYNWEILPNKSSISIMYSLVTTSAEEKTHTLSGMIFYTQDDSSRTLQVNKKVTVTKPSIVSAVDLTKDVSSTAAIDEASKETTPKPNSRVIYRVQVYAVYGGTTSSRLLQKRLKLPETVSQDYDGKYAKYTSGEFATYAEAAAYKKKLRATTVPGAFVVGFYEGARTKNIQQAIAIEKGQEPISSPKATAGIAYRIQIMASNKDLTTQEVKDITGATKSFHKIRHNSLYKYEIGNYKSYSAAKAALKQVRRNVPDAFLVKYIDGKRK